MLESALIEVSNIRRPLILIRGKSLTKEQLMEVITNTEPLFQKWKVEKDGTVTDEASYYNDRSYCGLLRNICFRKGFDWLDGWLTEDGTCYGSFYLPKYPYDEEWVPRFQILANCFPFLDMVATVVNSNESYCYDCNLCSENGSNRMCTRKCILKKWRSLQNTFRNSHQLKYTKDTSNYPDKYKDILGNHYLKNFFSDYDSWNIPFDISEDVIVTALVKDGECKLLAGEDAKKKFKEYDTAYGDFRLSVTQNSYFYKCSNKPDKPSYVRFSTQFFRDCLEYAGLPKDLWDEEIEPKYLMNPVSTKEVVVTKEWLFTMYDNYFKGTLLDIEKIKDIFNL